MTIWTSPRQICLALCLAAVAAAGPSACRKRAAPQPEARRGSVKPPSRAVLPSVLLVDAAGGIFRRSIDPAAARARLFANVQVAAIEALSQAGGGLAIAARATGSETLLLLREGHGPKKIAEQAVYAAFAPDGRMLMLATRRLHHLGGGVAGSVEHTAVYDLASDRLKSLGPYGQPRWEADGVHLRATRLERRLIDRPRRSQVRWSCNRMRINALTGAAASIGPGDAQIPAPAGAGVAWREAGERPALPASEHGDRCRLSLGSAAPSQHAVEGALCLGRAADRSVRWSADGRWLAFASFVAGPAREPPRPRFLQIVSLKGRPHPAVSVLRGKAPAGAAASLAGYPWIDWSPAGDRLAVLDPGGQVAIYQLRPPRVTPLGSGNAPRWSPDGGHLLLLRGGGDAGAAAEAVVVEARPPHRRRPLGPARDARWLRNTD